MQPTMPSLIDLPLFDATHRERAAAFRAWVDAQLGEFEGSEGGDGTDARRIFTLLGASGWLERTVATTAPDLRHVCLMREALAYRATVADVAFSEPWLAILPLLLQPDAPARERRLDAYRAGREVLAFALSEPDAGSDVASIATAVTPGDGSFTIDGRKTWTSNSGLADGYVVFARESGVAGKGGIGAYFVEGRSPGVRLVERIRVLSPHTVGTLAFDAARVAVKDGVIAPSGRGFDVAMRALELFRPTVAAACVGFARRALDEALRRCRERVAFGRPIAQHQMIQAKLADMAVKIHGAALLTYHAAWSADSGAADAPMLASIAKLHASEIAQQVVDDAVQIFGGLGVAHGQPVERLYRHVRAFRIFDGTSEIQRLIIARHLLG